ncbi:MAG: type II toxin-antitoxin system RelE/ParE family toxin [Acidobacteriota bacterium]
MMGYQVIITSVAQKDVEASYRWGVKTWGKTQAERWTRQMRKAVKGLATFPDRCPLAPEDNEFAAEIRQLIVGRYRVLFTVRGRKVYVLHIRGAYLDKPEKD